MGHCYLGCGLKISSMSYFMFPESESMDKGAAHLPKDEDSDSQENSLPLGKEQADRDLHADSHEERGP